MAAKEMYDYLSVATADNDVTLTLNAVGTLVEHGTKNQVIHIGDDGSEERIDLAGGTSIFYLDYPWKYLTESDAGTVMDFWHDAAKGNGRAESFKLAHSDGHTYVVRFDTDLSREIKRRARSIVLRFKILGRIADP